MKLSLPSDVTFNTDKAINFLNGRYDLNHGCFMERLEPSVAFPMSLVSEVLPYDYTPSSEADLAEMWAFLRKTFQCDEDLNYVLYVFASALLGDVSGCTCLFHVGKGSTGKTTLLRLVEHTFGFYVQKLPSHVFDSRATANRVLSEVRNTSRFLIVNELNKKPKDANVIKAICDGEISTTKLYKGGGHDSLIKGKLFCTV